MSRQRACVNCRRCYELMDRTGAVANDQNAHIARNEAMKALERVIDGPTGESSSKGNQYIRTQSNAEKAILALDACRGCDYKEPKIDRIYNIDETGA